MGSSGGSSGGGDSQTTIRYASYVESQHSTFLATVASNRAAVVNDSPFADYTDIEIETSFFGAGLLISSFESLYSVYGRFMLGLDLNTLWTQVFADTVNSAEVRNLVVAENALVEDDIETTAIPRLQTGMRDLNSVMSSTFVIGKAIIEDAKVKTMAKFSADLKYRLIPIASSRWTTTLEWNKNIVGVYAELMKFYFATKIDVDEVNYAMASKDKLWPFSVLDFERAALGALQGATVSKTDVAGASTASKVIGGALSGAAMGAMVGSSFNTAATTTGGITTAANSMGSVYGALGGTALGIAAALTY